MHSSPFIQFLDHGFQLAADEYVKADYRRFFVFDGLDHNISAERVEESIPQYLDFLENF